MKFVDGKRHMRCEIRVLWFTSKTRQYNTTIHAS